MSAAGTWGTPLKLLPSSQGTASGTPLLLVDSVGIATTAWLQTDGVSRRDAWAARADATGAWASDMR